MMNQPIFFLDATPRHAKPKVSVVLPPAEFPVKRQVFADAMLDTSSVRQKRNPLKWAASLGAHIAVLTLLVLMPLYFSQGLSLQRLNATLLVAPLPPMAAPPPPPAAAPRVSRVIPKTFIPGKLTAPSFVPKVVATLPDAGPPAEAISGMVGGIPGGVPGGETGGILGGALSGVPAPAAPSTPSAVGPRQPVRVGGTVQPPRLLSGPEPIYPILARQGMVQGIVVIDAVIDEHGNVAQEKLVSGHPLLVPAAMKAVSLRKYSATALDGEPVPVALRVEITFHMN